MSLEAYTEMEARTLPKIRDAERRARRAAVPESAYILAGPEAEQKWKALSISEQRGLVAAVADVTILPAGRAKWKFDPRDVPVKWRT
jgi:hypothetical protein